MRGIAGAIRQLVNAGRFMLYIVLVIGFLVPNGIVAPAVGQAADRPARKEVIAPKNFTKSAAVASALLTHCSQSLLHAGQLQL